MNSTRSLTVVVAAIAFGCGSLLALYWPRSTLVIESHAASEVQPAQPADRDAVEPRACDTLAGITTSCVYG
jgi:hypothetical protein